MNESALLINPCSLKFRRSILFGAIPSHSALGRDAVRIRFRVVVVTASESNQVVI
jgi:hypothetical protein